ncbi:MAG: hypothetical protein KGJ13_00820 [Patescibacteria group bacterium]|nr:hypothetical protein [Patescibacteria group bacterium]
MHSRKLPKFSHAERRKLWRVFHDELAKTTQRLIRAFFDDMGARIDQSPYEVELLKFNILFVLSREAPARLTRGLATVLESYADEMEWNDNAATGIELRALAHIIRERIMVREKRLQPFVCGGGEGINPRPW